MKKAAIGLLLLGCLAGAAFADQADVFLKDGRRLRGDVTETATHVIIKTAAGELAPIPKSDVLRIVRRTTPDDTYKSKVAALERGDLDGHFEVAEWAASIGRWDLVVRQCNYILGLKRDHRNAKLLLEQARLKQAETANQAVEDDKKAPQPEADEEKAESDSAAAPFAPLLSKRDIQRLKINELSTLIGVEDKIRVKFVRKRNELDLDRLFVKEMQDKEGYGKGWANKFLRQPPNEQVVDIVGGSGLKHADRIEIAGDPMVFSVYRRSVLPLIARNCARSGCHGAAGRKFAFPRGSKRSEPFAYTSFFLLDSMNTKHGRMINREDPHASALLGFMLPQAESEQPHPEVKRGGPRFAPVFKNRSERNFTTVLDWISSLALPRPAYGLKYELPATIKQVPPPAPVEAATTQPEVKPAGDKPTDDKPPAKKDDDP